MKIKDLFYLLKHLGPRWLAYRCYYALAHRLNLFARTMPPGIWQDVADYPESSAALSCIPDTFTQPSTNRLNAFDVLPGAVQNVATEADAVLRGEFVLFSLHRYRPGFPPDWHVNAMTGEKYDKNLHWSKIPDFGHGDIKCVWEINRFSWAFTLARAYARTADEKFAEGFWLLFEDWLAENQPNCGVNWKCGQEATFRLMAASFARKVFAGARATTEARLMLWRKFVAFTAHRIAGNLDYALSQNNNHGISECIGLITAVKLLPGIPDAQALRERAVASLVSQLETLTYQDGGFSQHSTVYHRVVLHDLTWYLAVEKAAENSPDQRIIAAAGRALHFLAGITDLATGLAPLHGPNDGANVLPLSASGFLDMRPALVALAALLHVELPIVSGAHDEALFWLSQPVSAAANAVTGSGDFFAEKSGWHIIAGADSRVFCYAPTVFRHRPAQADLLHTDLWWRGQPITRDPGSFSYNASGQFASMLNSTAVHNTVGIDSVDQMHTVSRFLYLPWPKAAVAWQPAEREFTAMHNAYKDRDVQHTRVIRSLPEDRWQIEDLLVMPESQKNSHEIRLHWLLVDYPYTFDRDALKVSLHTRAGDISLQLKTECSEFKIDLVRADAHSDRGWWSPFYFYAEPALSLQLAINISKTVKIISIFQP